MKNTKTLIVAGLLSSALLTIPTANANTLGADSIYTFTSVDTEGSNIIREAVYNSMLNTVQYKYNRLDLTNSVTGSNIFGSGDTSVPYDINGIQAVAKYSTEAGNYIGITGTGKGGALENNSGDISVDFVNNKTSGSYGIGGAFYTENALGKITGNYINNEATNSGGAIYFDKADSINANFIGNHVNGVSAFTVGGAIVFKDKVGGIRVDNISGNFIGNYVASSNGSSGGAIQFSSGDIDEYGVINSITANFIGNYVDSQKYSRGGALDLGQYVKIGTLSGDFIRNWAVANSTTTQDVTGGAIHMYKNSEINTIKGDFIENYVKGSGQINAYGGVIHSLIGSKIGEIKGEFLSNYAESETEAKGGVFYNFGEITTITDSVFNNNHLTVNNVDGGVAQGSVLYNEGTVTNIINSNFVGNYIDAPTSEVHGGVIYNALNSIITNITNSNFIGNSVTGISTLGGVIYNGGTINEISNVSFVGNKSGNGNGGAVYNIGTINKFSDITFTNNEILGNGGAIYNTQSGLSLENITANSNKSGGKGGVIYTNTDITIENSKFGENGLNYHKNGNADFVANDIFADANSNINFIAETDSLVNSGIAGSGKLVKTGAGNLVLSGSNSDFTGDIEVNEGSVKYIQTVADGFINGDVKILENAAFTFSNTHSDNIQKISGSGEFIKSGNGDLALTDDYSGFDGTVNITEGSLIYSDAAATSKFFSTNTNYKVNSKFKITNNTDNLQLQNLSGSGTVEKSGSGLLNLAGNNNGFNGIINLTNGIMKFVSDNTTSYISGKTTLSGNSVLNYEANKESQMSNVSGSGTLNYTGSNALTFNPNNDFLGKIYADGTKLNISDNSNNTFNSEMLVNQGVLNYTGTTGAKINIDNKIGFTSTANNATIQLNGASYELNNEIANSTNNNIIFSNTNLVLNSNEYLNGKYTVQNSIIDLSQDNHAVSDRKFNNLALDNNVGLKIDVNLLLPDNAKSDTLTVVSGGNTINVSLSQIQVNDSRTDNGLGNSYTINVLNGLTFDEDKSIGTWSTPAYTYKVETSGSNLILTAIKASTTSSLGEMNTLNGNRGFNFTEQDNSPYVINSNLGTTCG